MTRERHPYPAVEHELFGLLRMWRAACPCGWTSEWTTEEREANHEQYMHYERNKSLTWDDVCWGLGIGSYGQ